MALIEVKSSIDPQNDAVELVLDLVGNDPFQHEFLKQVFADDLVKTEDEAPGTPDAAAHAKAIGEEDVRIRLPFKKAGAFAAAKRVIENRERVAMGRPTVEQEEAAAAAQEKAQADAQAAAADSEKKAAEQKLAEQAALGEAIGRGMAAAQAEKK